MSTPAVPTPPSVTERTAFPGAHVRAQSRRNAVHATLAVLLVATTFGAYFFAGLGGVLAWLAAAVLPSFGLLAWQRARTPAGGSQIEVGPEGLFAAGKVVVPRAQMQRAVVVAAERGAVVSIQRTQGFFVAVDVASEEEGHRLVSALGLGAAQRRAEFMVDSPLAARFPKWAAAGSLAALLAIAMLGLAKGMLLAWLIVVPWYLLVVAWLRPTNVTIGTDGVLLSWLGRKTLVPFSEMAAVAAEKGGLRFDLSDGRVVRVRAEWTSAQRLRSQPEFASADVYLEALAARIEQAKAAAGGPDIAVLERKDRPLGDWIQYLRGLTERGAAGFRAAPVLFEALWKTVENGHAEPAARAAAAVALGPALDESGKERLRIAAGVVVTPKLRVVLEAAAAGDEEALTAALGEVEAAGLAPRPPPRSMQ
jgi:hypothetical protein